MRGKVFGSIRENWGQTRGRIKYLTLPDGCAEPRLAYPCYGRKGKELGSSVGSYISDIFDMKIGSR